MEVADGKIEADWWANVPLSDVRKSFRLSPEIFENTFHAEKPNFDDEIILQCRSGYRSGVAQKMLIDLGFTNTKNLQGRRF